MSVFGGIVRASAGRVFRIAAALAGLTAVALAQAGGPEYFRIIELKTDDNVNVRAQPRADSKVVGKIPKSTDGVKNHGCKGGLTAKQWEKATAARKKEDQRASWCEVEYKDVKGWLSRRLLVDGSGAKQEPLEATATPETPAAPPAEKKQTASPPPPPQKIAPSFDCDKAEKNAEKLICADNSLAALDREVARLYKLASDALNAMPGFETLLDAQRKWLGERNTCFDQDCLTEMHVRRVHQLRQSYSAARKMENASRSAGPYVLRCEGLDALVGVTIVTTAPAYAHVEWRNSYLVMKKMAGPGVHYEGNFGDLRAKGNNATLKLPGGEELSCKLETGG
jgi:uncharacterized protein YecT (DUF1311 family)/uncharacterized protein YraI